MSCLFCKIIERDIPARIIFEDDNVLAFDDIAPQAPVHKLIIPKLHISTLNDLDEEKNSIIGHMASVAKKLAGEFAIAESGYRIVMNCNEGAGQTVFHIHMHLLGGRNMHWPPG